MCPYIIQIKNCKIQEKSIFFILSQQQEGEGDDVTKSTKKRLGYKNLFTHLRVNKYGLTHLGSF